MHMPGPAAAPERRLGAGLHLPYPAGMARADRLVTHAADGTRTVGYLICQTGLAASRAMGCRRPRAG
jgi:hypothetical protein